MVSTHLKNISQIGSFPQVGVNIRNVWNHHLAYICIKFWSPQMGPLNDAKGPVAQDVEGKQEEKQLLSSSWRCWRVAIIIGI